MNQTVSHIAILINEHACQGKAKERWRNIRNVVLDRLPGMPLEIPFSGNIELEKTLEYLLLKEQVNGLISAGGDGSIHYLANALLKGKRWKPADVALGAIGLGSSNDFHKPVQSRLQTYPVQINTERLIRADVGRVLFRLTNGPAQERYFLINASLGVTAAANYLFNHPDWLLRWLKKHWTTAAITFAVVRTILRFRAFSAQLQYNGTKKNLALTNLAILKNPHVSGNFCYDLPLQAEDGLLGLSYCEALSKRALIGALWDLYRRRFSGKPGRYAGFIEQLEVQLPFNLPLEMDGEIVKGRAFAFSLIPGALTMMTK